ncbi:altered inheritance of mitochondria protein 21, partial [Tirmania nivea]
MDSQQASQQPVPPSVPPRPNRAKASSTMVAVEGQPDIQDRSEPEPVIKTTAIVPSDMEVHAPIARSTGVIPPNRPGFLRSTSLGTSTPPRQLSNDTGIPEIGKQVPMYPNAGDVQAPTPNPSRQASGGPAQAKKGPRAISHVTKKEDYGEYGSGLHPFERRSGHYSMSSEDLNQIVAQTATPTAGNFPGVPEEELGYLASEEYAKAIGTATPREELTEAEANKLHKLNSGESTQTRDGSQSPEVTIHIQPRAHERSGSHPYGRHNLPGKFSQSQTSLSASSLLDAKDPPEEEEYGQKDGEFRDEHFSGTPILASDEITKRGGTSTPHYHPAVSPPLGPRRAGSKPASRAPSRPPSRGAMREPVVPEPLPDVEEHEPLFPEDDEIKESQTALREGVEKAFAGRISRSSRKFPSNDIWEDAPPSSHLSATVASPPPGLSPLGLDALAAKDQGAPAEEPQDEESDRLGVPNRHRKSQSPDDQQSKPLRPAVLAKTASGKQRFPSKDIWEEAPDSAQLTTTVSPTPANEESQSPVETTAPEVEFPPNTASARATTGAHLDEPNLHVNPDERTSTSAPLEAKNPESPARSPSPEKQERWGPTGAAPPPVKPKPAIGGKIAALKANLALEQKLAVGPLAFKKKEEGEGSEAAPEEPKPLVEDVRKSRAKGPRGRKLPTA